MESHRNILYVKFFIGLLFCFLAGWGFLEYKDYRYRKNDGFSLANVQFTIPYKKEFELSLSSEENNKIATLLNQKFFYLSKGARSFAFVSEDGEYVIKFFKFRYAEPHWAVRYLPSIQPFEYFRQKKIHKVSLDTVLTGYKNAYEKDPQGTGIIYIHLNEAPKGLPQITVHDKAGKSHLIPLDTTRFIFQRKVKELGIVLKELLQKGNVAEAKKKLSQTLDLYVFHFQQGIYDLGEGLIRNNGFIGDLPVHFDTGKMTLNEKIKDKEIQHTAMLRLISNGDKWISMNFPEYRNEIQEMMGAKLKNLYGQEP